MIQHRPASPSPLAEVLTAFKTAVGAGGWVDDPKEIEPYLQDWRGLYKGASPLLLKPKTVVALSSVVRIAAAYGVALIPQGGNTGLVRGSVPDTSGNQIVVSLSQLNGIRSIDADDFSLVAEAGVILSDVQSAAESVNRLFPLSLGSEGSARIGGLIATNAGGVHVLRYGTMRSLVLGLEAVLPDGSVFHGLSSLRKDNTGYDLKQLLIGSEGTLGFITAATLKLFPRPSEVVTVWAALSNPQDAVRVLARLRMATGDQVNAFELLPRDGVDLVLRHIPGSRDPLPSACPWYVLTEIASAQPESILGDTVQKAFADFVAEGLMEDAVFAHSKAQAKALWRLRETLPEAEKKEGASIHHDVSVSVARMPEFIEMATPVVEAMIPGSKVLAFGHLGDGNVHFNLRQPPDMDPKFFRDQWELVSARVNDLVCEFGGSISAEHGIGTLKQKELVRLADPAKMAALWAIKAALDPKNIMNPGKLL